ncbi:MAG: hypothetical protein CO108_19990 [Deltaproteobacteria bacterium CG_4_9_14_3_um_filter_63_12]|nr:MAG: hypothetical protein COW42_00470 [Deltaproteobacteria bacterium CG17_big_fil_post_rev_8_21_14_2_50_63_7]PJB37924.1 MAG: hypothetical protein CO108_19990 [Deltaproteobacteria bacterium CG_4_9_14_3_um_filter_63_12]
MSFARVISEMLNQNHQGRVGQSRMMGNMIAIVTNNVDPEDRYRVKVKYPWLHDTEESFWARIGTGLAGKEIGQFFLPEVDDEVLVTFQEGDFERPVLVGSLWNGEDKSPRDITYSPDHIVDPIPNQQQGGKNDFRFFRSRMWHHLMFKDRPGEGSISLRTKKTHELYLDDTDGAEKIRLYDKDQKQWLEIDVPAKLITLETDTGDILIKAKKTITLDCKDLVVKASKTIKVESGTSSEWKAGSTINWKSSSTSDYEASSVMTIKGSKIDLNP